MTKRFELSPLQREMWETQRELDGLRVQSLVRLNGVIEPERMEQALNQAIQHNEILRTVFQPLPGLKVPVQVVKAQGKVAFEYQALKTKQTDNIDEWVNQLWQEHKIQRFDWENGPLLHCTLATLKSDQHVLLITFPAICGDAQSMSNLISQIAALYIDYITSSILLDEELVQYSQYSQWLRDLLESASAAVGKGYWAERVSRVRIGLHLACDEGDDGGVEFEPQIWSQELSRDLLHELESLAFQQEVSVASILLASWQILLGRLSGQSEFDLAFVINGRHYPELQPALGLFTRWLPMRCKFDPNKSAQELYLQTQQEMTELEEWQDYYLGDFSSTSSRPFGFSFSTHPTKWLANGLQFTLERLYSYTQPFRLHLACQQ